MQLQVSTGIVTLVARVIAPFVDVTCMAYRDPAGLPITVTQNHFESTSLPLVHYLFQRVNN
jgi:hypothetical protein